MPGVNDGTGTVWMMTISRRRFHPLAPDPSEIDLGDIAHSLARQCRFGGHVAEHYSVAQHSCLVARRSRVLALLGGQDPVIAARWGLLHDASEAYIVDVPRPVKQQLSGYKTIESLVMGAIARRFGLPDMPSLVKVADEEILATEARALFSPQHDTWNLSARPVSGIDIVPWDFRRARESFLEIAAMLGID